MYCVRMVFDTTQLTAEWSTGGKGSMTFALSEGMGNPSES